jgi:FaeA-like protein
MGRRLGQGEHAERKSRLFAAIRDSAHQPCTLTDEKLAAKIGLSKPQVRFYLNQLKAEGLIEWEVRTTHPGQEFHVVRSIAVVKPKPPEQPKTFTLPCGCFMTPTQRAHADTCSESMFGVPLDDE